MTSHIRSPFMVGPLLAGVLAAPLPAGAANPELAQQAYGILKKYCHSCHGVEFKVEGLNVLDRDVLVAQRENPYIVPGKPEESYLLDRVRNGEMPPRKIKERPSAAEQELLKAWVAAGAPFPQREQRRFKSQKDILADIAAHLQKTPRQDRRFQRFFTLTHLSNNTKHVTDFDLRLYRAALSKLANSLSWEPDLVVPEAIDKEQTVYVVDLRRLGWHRRNLWGEILKDYPYGLKHSGHRDEQLRELAQEVYDLAGSDLPYLRADWFVAMAARPPLYHTLLELPTDAAKLEEQLRVNVKENYLNNLVARAGFPTSGVSRQNRLVERHTAAHGAYWKSYDFKSNGGKGNLLRFPLGPDFKDNPFSQQAFEHDGGEIIFNLPNRLQGYLLVDGKDQRIDAGPIRIVRDALETSGTPEVINGLSCMHCHRHGMIRELRDVIREGHSLGREARQKIEQLFPPPARMDQLLKADQDRFLAALEQATGPFLKVGDDQGKDIRDFPEPIGSSARFYLKDLNLEDVACELGLEDPAKLQGIIASNSRLRELGLGPLVQGAAVKRDLWDSLEGNSLFQRTALELELGTPLSVRP